MTESLRAVSVPKLNFERFYTVTHKELKTSSFLWMQFWRSFRSNALYLSNDKPQD